ncbi:MAG: CTP synthase [Alphaproteobacteria bacterium]
MTRFIFVTGGVVSSLGKGLASAALGSVLQARGYSVKIRKFDPYLNVDPGTMSPKQHGEVYVTEDGAETDLDLGHYERFTGVACSQSDNVTTGRLYQNIIQKERNGDYNGATVQVIPHVTDEIKHYIQADLEDDLDFLIVEVGGTVGDIEGLPYLEAIRQFMLEIGRERSIYLHLTLIPFIPSADEIKTKPSQHSVKELLHVGIQPDILLCRCDRPIPDDARRKLALFCNLKPECVIEAPDVKSIYQVPITYSENGLDVQVLDHFNLPHDNAPDLSKWESVLQSIDNPTHEVTIAVVAKYTALRDAYKSLTEAILHGGVANNAKVNVTWIDAEELEHQDGENGLQPVSQDQAAKIIGKVDGVLVPGGFGIRGVQGKKAAVTYARENKIPFLGICLGMQTAVVEAAQNLAGMPNANSTEISPTTEPVVGLLTEWVKGDTVERRDANTPIGGTMRLGAYRAHLEPGSLAHRVYGTDTIEERHRHRYEVNINYREALEKAGFFMTGMSTNGQLPEMMERKDHPWFLCTQAHPELKSYPFQPSPIFSSYIEACVAHGNDKKIRRIS